MFAVPTRKFAHYQLTKALPWWFKRWVLFQRNAKLEPLYRHDNSERAVNTSAETQEVNAAEDTKKADE